MDIQWFLVNGSAFVPAKSWTNRQVEPLTMQIYYARDQFVPFQPATFWTNKQFWTIIHGTINPRFGVGGRQDTLCLGRPLERFRVLASGRVCGRARTLLQKYGICNFSLKWLSRPSLPCPQLGKFVGIAYNWMPGMLSRTPQNPSFSPLFASTAVTFQVITPKPLEIGVILCMPAIGHI